MKVTILGCGASNGVPVLGCGCATCLSPNPKNRRTRVSVFVETGDLKLLIDAGPDLRQQALAHNITEVNAVIFTHAHADHAHGIDELRNFNFLQNAVLDSYMDARTYSELHGRFGYCFAPPIPEFGWFRPALRYHPLEPGQRINVRGVIIEAFTQFHGTFMESPEPYVTLGLRIGDFAYSTDVKELPETSFKALEGVKYWVVDCLRPEPAPTHAHLELVLSWINRVNPQKAWLTHMNHHMEYEALRKSLPEAVEPAYDGLVLSL